MSPAAVYPHEAIQAHLAFLARRRSLRPGEYRVPADEEWTEFLGHPVELRKVALGTCGRDHGTPCAHENARVMGHVLDAPGAVHGC